MTRQLFVVAIALIPGAVSLIMLFLGADRHSDRLSSRIAMLSGAGREKVTRADGPAAPRSLQKSGITGGGWRKRTTAAIRSHIRGLPSDLGPARLGMVAAAAAAATSATAVVTLSISFEIAMVLGILAAVAAPALAVRHARQRRATEVLATFPDALDLIVRALRAGLPLAEAFHSLVVELPGPLAEEFQRVNGEMSVGVPLETALDGSAVRIGLPDFRFFAAAVALARETGGNLTETLQNLSHIVRRRKELQLKARAMTAEARTSTLVIGALPFVAGIALAIISPDYIGKLFSDPRGPYVLGAAGASMTCGLVTMRLLIRRSTS